jgi:hypothetical protein
MDKNGKEILTADKHFFGYLVCLDLVRLAQTCKAMRVLGQQELEVRRFKRGHLYWLF